MAYLDYKDLNFWKKSMDIAVDIYMITKNFPKEETYALANQMQRAASSIPSNIAEGHGRFSPKDFLRFIKIAHGSANEIDTQLELAFRLGYISLEVRNNLGDRITEVRRMLLSFAKYLESIGGTKN
ncbi:MAG: four helix bundle protein [Bacteroidales bacterium]|nr:four helix bundle protein [Bacteroidales bacterium]